jgi:hypothetical protein
MDNPKIRLGLDNSSPITCEACGNDTFVEANYLRRVSKLLTGSPEDMVMPVPTFLCAKCQHVNENFQLPEAKAPESGLKLS